MSNPFKAAKRLSADLEGTFRFRIGDWRVKFISDGNTLLVTRILHRSEAYR